jgi:sterol desaturase/sphingolipid hydroxylase (fatty acid hydroxylase superfamily)
LGPRLEPHTENWRWIKYLQRPASLRLLGPNKHLWIHHALHHYQQPDAAYGVSSPLWDFFFKTMPEKRGFNVKTKTGYIDDRQGQL